MQTSKARRLVNWGNALKQATICTRMSVRLRWWSAARQPLDYRYLRDGAIIRTGSVTAFSKIPWIVISKAGAR
jgi:hypothetical protein